MRNKKLLIVCVITVIMICITVCISVAFFNYAGSGTTDNSVDTGSITFLYTETSEVGRGISITDAFPISNAEGKLLTGLGNVFDFNISSKTTLDVTIPYEITARKSSESTLDEDLVVVYLTKVDGINEEQVLLSKYSALTQTSRNTHSIEKTLYKSIVYKDDDYNQDYRLRMWITDDGSYNEDDMGKTFTLTVNVYANGEVFNGKKPFLLTEEVLKTNPLITAVPTLTPTIPEVLDQSGLYKSTDTNSGDATYYFRGNVENNYVKFAEKDWRIVRINEDGTVRLVYADELIDGLSYLFTNRDDDYKYMYYTNSDIKPVIENWFQSDLSDYSDYIVRGNYFCEQAKVIDTKASTDNPVAPFFTEYVPNFKCSMDSNGYGIVNSNVGLMTVDEVLYSGIYFYENSNSSYYSSITGWTMSPSGMIYGNPSDWCLNGYMFADGWDNYEFKISPVINLKADVYATGTGTLDDPYVIE